MSTYERLTEHINNIPLIDVHTHVDLSHPSARGLYDILLYHMIVSELYSAGCPDGSRLSEWPSKAEEKTRMLNAIPYIKHIRYSSTFAIAKSILADLYDFDGDITADNWEMIDQTIVERYTSGPADEILDKANITAVNTEYCKKHGLENGRFFYSLEWAFFTRNQYGIYDAPVFELEVASAQLKPEGPIPVTADADQYTDRRCIKTVEQVDEAMEIYVSKIPFDKIVSLPTHFSTDIRYGKVSANEMQSALANRADAGIKERDIYANYINNKYFETLEKHGKKAVVAISVGAEPVKFETASKLDADTLFAIERLAGRYADIDFIIFNGSDYQDSTLASVIRETQNVYAAGFWWHNFYPSSITDVIRQRLERIPVNKWFGYFSDAYCVDWAYGKSRMIKDCYARVLSEMVEEKRFSFDDAANIAKRLLYQNAKDYFDL